MQQLIELCRLHLFVFCRQTIVYSNFNGRESTTKLSQQMNLIVHTFYWIHSIKFCIELNTICNPFRVKLIKWWTVQNQKYAKILELIPKCLSCQTFFLPLSKFIFTKVSDEFFSGVWSFWKVVWKWTRMASNMSK